MLSQLYINFEDTGGWQEYIKQKDGGHAARIVIGRLYGYLCPFVDLQGLSKKIIIPINFNGHWTVIMQTQNGKQWIINHADSIKDTSKRQRRIQKL